MVISREWVYKMFLSKLEDRCACNVVEYVDILEEGLSGTGMKIVEEVAVMRWITCVSYQVATLDPVGPFYGVI
jgi:hypothetical protein